MEMDRRAHESILKFETTNYVNTVSGTSQLEFSEHNNHRRKHKWPRGHTMARTTGWHYKNDRIGSRFLYDTDREQAINVKDLFAVVWGLEHLRLNIYGKTKKMVIDHQHLELLIEHNRSNKSYNARLNRWLDRF